MTTGIFQYLHFYEIFQIDSLVAEETPEARAETIFKIMDLNSDGRITRLYLKRQTQRERKTQRERRTQRERQKQS